MESSLNESETECEYLFLMASNIRFCNVKFKDKYFFQYVENVIIQRNILEKQAFWHVKNVIVKNSFVKRKYRARYSENIALINCKIIITQPLCYCKGLKFVYCEMKGTDFSFEYLVVHASVNGNILSVNNPKSEKIVCDSIYELVYSNDSEYECKCEIHEENAVGFCCRGLCG